MGYRLEKLERGVSRFNAFMREAETKGKPRRDMTSNDAAMFDTAAYERPPSPSKQKIIDDIRLTNPVRWARLNREYRWFQKQLRKRGLSPEDARYLL